MSRTRKKRKSETGWGNPEPFRSTSKFHYYDEDQRSLCGKWGRVAGLPTVEEGMDEHADNCAACKKKKLALNSRAKGAGKV
jgi:hypothetical protein